MPAIADRSAGAGVAKCAKYGTGKFVGVVAGEIEV